MTKNQKPIEQRPPPVRVNILAWRSKPTDDKKETEPDDPQLELWNDRK